MSDLPRLLLCSFDVLPAPSGTSRRLTSYLQALPDRFATIVLSAKTPEHSHVEKYLGARLLRVPVGAGDLPSRIQAFERAVRRQLDSEEYAVAHFLDPFSGYVLSERQREHGYRLLYEALGFPSQEMRHTHPALEADRRLLAKIRRQELFCLMNADLVLTGSEVTRRFIHSLGVAEEAVRVLRSPVEVGVLPSQPSPLPEGAPLRLLYLGSQVGWQGLTDLLRSVALAAAQAPLRLTLVGPRDPEGQTRLDELIKELALAGHVEVQDPVPHEGVASVLQHADVCMLPLEDCERNRVQGGPLAQASEYLGAGRPIIAADLPLTRELLPADATLFYPARRPELCAQRIVELARDPGKRLIFGQRAKAYAQRHLEAGLVQRRLMGLYEELLGRRIPSTEPVVLPASTLTATPTSRIERDGEPGPEPATASRRPKRRRRGAGTAAAVEVEEPPAVTPEVAVFPFDEASGTSVAPTLAEELPPSTPELPVAALPAEPPPEVPAPASRLIGAEETPELGAPPRSPEAPPRPPAEPIEPQRVQPEPAEVDRPAQLEEELLPELGAEPAPSTLDRWFAQLAHGYCPPVPARPPSNTD